ncbi:MAG: FHA domain-containing protein [Anaerolineales bacterium]|nr:FHA domain-containing protein [Anaerolineales bacterium]
MADSMHAAVLEGDGGAHTGKRYDLGPEPVRIGRGSTCSIIILDSMMSREHAEIRLDAGAFIISDLGSTHGTWVDGQQVQEARLADGARIRLGTSEFIFRLTQDAIPTRMLTGDEDFPAMAVQTPPPAPAAAIHDETYPPPASPIEPEEPPSKKPKKKGLLIGCGVVAAVGICAVLAVFAVSVARQYQRNQAAEDSPLSAHVSENYTQDDLALALVEPLDDERPQILENLGRPDEFDIAIVQVEGGEVRRESWLYYGFGTRVDFVDGVILWTIDLEQVPEGTIFPAWYDPTDFDSGLTIEAATALLAAASPAGMEPKTIDLSAGGEDLAGGTLLVGDQITLGFENGQLVYVETLGMSPAQEGGE